MWNNELTIQPVQKKSYASILTFFSSVTAFFSIERGSKNLESQKGNSKLFVVYNSNCYSDTLIIINS